MHVHFRMHFRTLSVVIVLALGVGVTSTTVRAETEHPTVRSLSTNCQSIFVGKVLSSECEKNKQGSLLTRVTFEVLYSVTEPQSVGSLVDITQLGGELDGEQFRVSETTRFDVNATYLVFAEDPERTLIPATLGGVHGCMRIVRGSDGALYPVMLGYRPIVGVRSGKFEYTRRAISISNGVAVLDATEEMRAPPVEMTEGCVAMSAVENTTAHAMTLDEVLALVHSMRGEAPQQLPKIGGLSGITSYSQGLTLCYCGFHNLHLVYEQVPTSWTSYDHNEWAMARWNNYIDMHRYVADDGGWGQNNNENEIAGWTSSASLVSEYGAAATWGASTLAVNASWSPAGCGVILENEIHFNPAVSWRYSLAETLGLGGPFLYDPILMHEMGHSLGLEAGECGTETYNFDRPSVMVGGSTTNVEDGRGIHRRDAKAIRATYIDQVSRPAITDMGIETWWMNGSMQVSKVSPTSLHHGDTITLNDVFVENMSTSSVAGVRVRVYLSTNTTITESDKKLGSYTDFGIFAFDNDWRGNITRTINSTVEPGTYYVGVIVTTQGSNYDWDEYTSNNATFYPTPITVLANGGSTPGDSTPLGFEFDLSLRMRILVDTTLATDDPDSPICPGNGGPTMGPSIFVLLTAPETGVMEVARATDGSTQSLVEVPDVVAAYTATANGTPGQLLGVACNTSTLENMLTVQVTAGQRYILRFGGTEAGAIVASYSVAIQPNRPFGSVPELALPWQNASPLKNFNMSPAMMSLPCAQSSSHGMWFVWTAPAPGSILATTCDAETNFPTVVSIHSTGPNPTLLACGASDAQCGNPFSAAASTSVTAGQKVLVRVASKTQLRGDFSVDIKFMPTMQAPQGCSNAVVIGVGVTPFCTIGRPPDNAPLCDSLSIGAPSVWFKFYSQASSDVMFDIDIPTGGSGISSGEVSLTVFGEGSPSQPACTNPVPLACSNVAGQSGGVQLAVHPGKWYYLRVASRSAFGAQGGAVKGSFAMTATPRCVGDLDHDGAVTAADLAILLNAWGGPDIDADLNGDGVVDASDIAIILNMWGPCV